MRRPVFGLSPKELLLAASGFALLAVAWTFPLVLRLDTHLAGRGGDGFAFAWNFWWASHAWSQPEGSLFWTDWIFHPQGTSLVFHTHTLANALLFAPLTACCGAVPAFNLSFLFSLTLGAFVAYCMARDAGFQPWSATATGLVFGFSAHVLSHADHGHHNLSNASWLLAFLLFFQRFLRSGRLQNAGCAGLFLALTFWNDYTLAVFGGLTAGWLLLARLPYPWRQLWPGLGLLAVGGMLTWKGSPLTTSPLFLALACLLLFLPVGQALRKARNTDSASQENSLSWRPWLLGGACLAGVFLLVAAPLLFAIFDLVRAHGGLPFQAHAPTGRWAAEPLGLFIPSNTHPVLGGLHQAFWGETGTHISQFLGWLAPPLALCGFFSFRKARQHGAFPWPSLGLVFLLLALGPEPSLENPAGWGWRSPFQALAASVPLTGGIRAPLRFLLLVHLSIALGVGCFFEWLLQKGKKPVGLPLFLLVLLALERLTAPFPMVSAHLPEIYQNLPPVSAQAPALLEIPVGFRTGTAAHPAERTVYQLYQTFHERPLTTGFVARESPGLFRQMWGEPIVYLLGEWTRADFPEATSPPPESYRSQAADFLRRYEIGVLLVHLEALYEYQPTAVLGPEAYQRMTHWLPRLFPLRWCGGTEKTRCFEVDQERLSQWADTNPGP